MSSFASNNNNNNIHKVRSSCRFVGLGICVIGHLSIEFSVVDGSTIRVGICIITIIRWRMGSFLKHQNTVCLCIYRIRTNIGGFNIWRFVENTYALDEILIWRNHTATTIINWRCTCCN